MNKILRFGLKNYFIFFIIIFFFTALPLACNDWLSISNFPVNDKFCPEIVAETFFSSKLSYFAVLTVGVISTMVSLINAVYVLVKRNWRDRLPILLSLPIFLLILFLNALNFINIISSIISWLMSNKFKYS